MSNGLYDVLALQGVTTPSANVSSEMEAGFEVKDGRYTAFASITLATFATDGYLSLQLGGGTRNITSAQAKKLAGVTAGEEIIVYCELYIDSLNDDRTGELLIAFFNESGIQQGVDVSIPVNEAGVWQQNKKSITVPSGATRINLYLHPSCATGETVKLSIAHIKIKR